VALGAESAAHHRRSRDGQKRSGLLVDTEARPITRAFMGLCPRTPAVFEKAGGQQDCVFDELGSAGDWTKGPFCGLAVNYAVLFLRGS